MTSSPITWWKIDEETIETVTDFNFLGSKSLQIVTETIKLKNTPCKKIYDKCRQCIQKQRHYFVNKDPSSQSFSFSSSYVWMWEWTIKKAEQWRNDAFQLWCWRDSWVPWTARGSNQSIKRKSVLNIHWKDWCWKWKSNTLATWCEELTHLKRSWCWERMKAGGKEDDRRWDGWMASPTQWTGVWVNSGSWWWTGNPAVHGVAESDLTERMNWSELNWSQCR